MKNLFDTADHLITDGLNFSLQKHGTLLKNDNDIDKDDLKKSVEEDAERTGKLQEKLYAENNRSLLLIFQAMDAAGKDSCIERVIKGVNPQGCTVTGFKAPSLVEQAHDFLWRHAKAAPAKGMIGVHNRSHYEEVLVVKVHPEFLLGQHLPGIQTVKDADAAFWDARYASIRNFEEHLVRQGTTILKFHLHMGRAAQKERLLERIDDAEKNWKFSMGDVKERGHWDAYMNAYEAAIKATATPHAPWYVVPADDQWETRAIVSRVVREALEAMDPRIPKLSEKAAAELPEARKSLNSEKD
ncbi:MAG: polyphosphate kinase 2 family protein [Flavobacteriales bacterium]|nr:polyphosphate kinase 2 family protein [Flavobacteriales bacterium]